jgi:hypothetical protein
MEVRNDEEVWELIPEGPLRIWPDPNYLLQVLPAIHSDEARKTLQDQADAIFSLQAKLSSMQEHQTRSRFSLFELGFLAGEWKMRHVETSLIVRPRRQTVGEARRAAKASSSPQR